jgi:FkbM family methyltransferase
MREIIPLGNRTVAVRLAFGAWAVVPTWNVDVAMGMIRDGVIEPWTSRAVEALLKPGQTYVNVGANFGYYMVLGAHCVGRTGRVHAIEANPAVLPWLMRSIYWAGYPDVIRLYNRAASDQDGLELDIIFDAQFAGGASVAQRMPAPEGLSQHLEDSFWENADLSRVVRPDGRVEPATGFMVRARCRTCRLDTLLAGEKRIDLLHMDIEGSEPAAIVGSLELIRRSPGMAMIMEWSPYYAQSAGLAGHTRAMCELFEGLGYSWYRICPERFEPGHPAPPLQSIRGRAELFATPHADLLAVRDLRAHHRDWPALLDQLP